VLAQRAASDGVAHRREEHSLLSERAPPQTGLARRPQSKVPHALAWLGIEMGKTLRMDARSWNEHRLLFLGRGVSELNLEPEGGRRPQWDQ
jgi:hypothetical protein